MASQIKRPKFNSDQRRELAKRKLWPEQIDALETIALPLALQVHEWEETAPPLNDVLKEIESVRGALGQLRTVLSALEAAGTEPKTHVARDLVRRSLEIAFYDAKADCETEADGESEGVFERLVREIATAEALVNRARELLPQEQTRHKTAAPVLIQRIVRALGLGFVNARSVHGSRGNTGEPLIYNFKVSAAPRSDFCRIVEVCYHAMELDSEKFDLERAISAYLRRGKKARQAAQVKT